MMLSYRQLLKCAVLIVGFSLSIVIMLNPPQGAIIGYIAGVSAEPMIPVTAVQKKIDEQALRVFMRRKLDASNAILEGLVIDDMRMVASGSEVLLEMSQAEKWRVSNDMLYRRFSREFIDSVNDLNEKAKAQSIDGASLVWVSSTMKCLRCHEWVRNTVLADGALVRPPNGPR